MHFLTFFLCLILYSSCSTFKIFWEKQDEDNTEEISMAKWVLNPQLLCTENALCFVGEGKTLSEAQGNVLNAVSKYFEVRVDSSVSFENEVNGNKSNESFSFILNETTKEILSGVKVIKTQSLKGRVFALGELNKSVNSNIFLRALRELDGQILENFKENKRRGLLESLKLFDTRNFYETRYELVSDNPYKSNLEVSKNDILKRLNEKKAKNVKVCLQVGKTTGEQGLKKELSLKLTNLGYLVQEKSQDCLYYFMATENFKEIPINVEGFEKYDVELLIDVLDSGLNKVLSIKENFTESGRNIEQIRLNLEKKTKEFLDLNSENLVVD